MIFSAVNLWSTWNIDPWPHDLMDWTVEKHQAAGRVWETRSTTLYSSESMRFDLAFVGLPLGYYLAYILSVSLCTSIEIRAPFLDAVPPIEIIFLCPDLFHHGYRVGHGVAGGRALSLTICTLLSWLRTHKCWRDTQVSVLVYFDEMISHMAPPKSHESGDCFRDLFFVICFSWFFSWLTIYSV